MSKNKKLFNIIYDQYQDAYQQKPKSGNKIISIGFLNTDFDDLGLDFDVNSILDQEGKLFFNFSQVAGLFSADSEHFLGIIDNLALNILAKYRSRVYFSFYEQQITAIIISGITKKEVTNIVDFFKKNIKTYEKYQYHTTEVDYNLEDGVVYDIEEINFNQDIENVILYFN